MIAVTGATGYIGRVLIDELRHAGLPALALSRRQLSSAATWKPYDLGQPLLDGTFDGVEAVVHLAAETRRGPFADVDLELAALDRIIAVTNRDGIRLVFVSSQASSEQAPTGYGQAKWQCERKVLAAGGVVVRPGQVYGGAESGLFGTLCRLANRSPLIPHFQPDPLIQPVHVQDLARSLIHCATSTSLPSGIYQVAATEPVAFSTFLRLLADIRFSRSPTGVPLPMRAITTAGNLPFVPGAIKAIAQRLRSLADLPVMDTADSLRTLEIKLRSLQEGLSRSGRGQRRMLVLEARTLLQYILRRSAPTECIKHYVRAVEALYAGEPMVLRPAFRRWPSLLSFTDQPTIRRRKTSDAFWARLDLATVCAETSAESAPRFLALSRENRFLNGLVLAFRVGMEGTRQICGLLLGRSLDRLVPLTDSERRTL